jgi:hypothetical protein
MRALIIELMTPQVQCLLRDFLAQALVFHTDIAMQPLMGSIILGMTRTPTL